MGSLKDATLRHLPWLALALITVATLYILTKVAQAGLPWSSYLLLWCVPAVAVAVRIRRALGRVGVFGSIMVGHLTAVVLLSANRSSFAVYALLALVIPGSVLLGLFTWAGGGMFRSGVLGYLMVGVFSAALAGDLLYSARQSRFVYSGQPNIGRMMAVDTRPAPPLFPHERHVFPSAWITTTGHTIRYPSILYRQPFVFSPVEPSEEAVRFAIKNSDVVRTDALRNPSFEHWRGESWQFDEADGDTPDEYTYVQDGWGGGVRRNLDAAYVRDGQTSAGVHPSSKGDSMLRQRVGSLSNLGGHFVRFSVWVKSANRSPKGVQIDVQTADQRVGVRSYENTGEWESIDVAVLLPENAGDVFVTMSVAQSATAPAFFDGAMLEVSTTDYVRDALGFEVALRSPRSSSLMLKRDYVDLIQANVPGRVKSSMFAVGRPMIRLLEGIIEIDQRNIENVFRRLDERGESVVQRVAVVTEQGAARKAERSGARLFTEESVQSVEDGPCKRGMVRVEAYTYDRAEFTTEAEAACVLYWADAYDRRWRASVNGDKSPILRANVNFKAVVVPAGRNNVRFDFAPILFEAGLWVYYGTLGVSLVGAGVSKVWASRRKQALQAAEAAANP